MKKQCYSTLFVLFAFLATSKAQTDTLFWFAPPQISTVASTYDGEPVNKPIRLYFAAKNAPATVTITQPAAGSGMPAQTVTVPAHSMSMLDLTNWINVIETTPANSVLTTGLKITSTAPISVYYNNDNVPNTESFMLKGSAALGADFWVPSQNIGYNGNASLPGISSFDIVATQDKTEVTITPSKDIVGHSAGAAFSVTLDAGQTWSATAAGIQFNQHLGGSRVTSNQPIAITIKDDLLYCNDIGNGYDLVGDQILPTNKLGKKYIAVKGDLSGLSDRLFVMPTEDSTTVLINGTSVLLNNAGQTSAFAFANAVTYIEASKPISVYQLSGYFAELGAKQLASIDEKGCDTAFYQRHMVDIFEIMIITPTGDVNGFMVNGSSGVISGSQFTPVPGNAGYSYAKVDLSSVYATGTTVMVTNVKGKFQMSAIDCSVGWGCDYAYFNDFTPQITTDTTATPPPGQTGIGKIGRNGTFNFYPNPATDILMIEAQNVAAIRVFNVLGQEQRLHVNYTAKINSVNTQSLAAGNYIAYITNRDGETASLKFTKAR